MYIEKSIEEKIELFEANLLESNRGFNFYVDWNNITGLDKYCIELHALDSLIGCTENFSDRFVSLLTTVPSVIRTFPFLFALSKDDREKAIKGKSVLKVVGTEIDSNDLQEFSFTYTSKDGPLSPEQIENYLSFFNQMGLTYLFQNLIEKSVIDYVTGVLVGLDSNGRKNRGGKSFELACEPLIRESCEKHNVEVIAQKQFKTLSEKGFHVNEDIANRKADFILLKDCKCMNIEVNFFNGAGSKPEEIIDSYINRQADLLNNNVMFALITDGKCWQGTTHQLSKGFRHLDYLMNYRMAKIGMLEEIIEKVFG